MKFIFSSEEQKQRVIAKIETVSPEMAKELYLNLLKEGEISETKPQLVEESLVDEKIPQIILD